MTISLSSVIAGASSEFQATALALGSDWSLQTSDFAAFTLTSTNNIATVDFGVERAGIPFFTIADLQGGPAQVEVRYSEQFNALSQKTSDGPYPFALSLSNCFRVETFNVTATGRIDSPLLQGGQRWHGFKLLTGGSVTISEVGETATVDTRDVADLPGSFDSDDDDLNEIWALGARSALTACFDKGSQPAIWTIDPEDGALVQSLRPSQSLSSNAHMTYTLEFDVKIVRGGIWWNVAFPLAANSGIQLMLTSELAEDSTFVNVDKDVTPPNTISVATGFAFVQQVTLPSSGVTTYDVPFDVKEGEWYHITTASNYFTKNTSISINGTEIFNVTTPGGSSYGSFGFGAWQDQAAYVRNVIMKDTADGTVFFNNSMTDADSVLPEFGVQPNLEAVCLDGPKRDRLVWLGDFYHTSRIIPVSSARSDLVKGTLDFVVKTQVPDGNFNTAAVISYDPTFQTPYQNSDGSLGQQDYEVVGVLAFNQYIRQSGDVDWVNQTWPQWQLHVENLISQISTDDGLLHLSYGFTSPGDGSAGMNCGFVEALNGMSASATLIGDSDSAQRYTDVANNLTSAINNKLWNSSSGAYAYTIDNLDQIDAAGTGLCITSGVSGVDFGSETNRTMRALAAVASLASGPGYKDSTSSGGNDNISPFKNGFLLPGFFINDSPGSADSQAAAKTGYNLIKSLWGAMKADPGTNSGASWEYVATDNTPGLSYFTSLAHPWGGAATYVLTEYVAGIRAADGVDGLGYKSWIARPQGGVDMGLQRASASVQTPDGILSFSWSIENGQLSGNITAPANTKGEFVFNGQTKVLNTGATSYTVSAPVSNS